MNNKTIIISTIGLLFLSFIFLSIIEEKKQNINSQDWWAIYFENPTAESLNFTIENHADVENFHWEILADKTVAKEGEISIKKGETKKIPVSSKGIEDKKITISVTDSKDSKKEIYKNL